MIQITLTDLIQTLRKAASNPEGHEPAQRRYFSELQDDSVLVNCGTACCIAGDLALKAHADASKREIKNIIKHWTGMATPGIWVAKELGLSYAERILAFDGNTHYEAHLLLADLLEAGLRIPDSVGTLGLSCESTYTAFDYAYFGFDESRMNLEELKAWMRSVAK